jgi:hypothetical protein
VPAQPLARVDPPPRDPRGDAASPQRTAQGRGIVRLVGVQLGRALPGPPRPSPRPDDRRDLVDQGEQLGRVVDVGRREADGEGDAPLVDDEVVLGARLAAVGRVRPGRLAPLLARTLRLSTLARLQSMAASSPSQLSTVVCNRSQTPASCQSRSRRQQVVPFPQPSSFGRSRHGQPVRRTKMIPPSAARFGTRGRPPFGLGGSLGKIGSIASQRSSGTRDWMFMISHHVTPLRFCNTL